MTNGRCMSKLFKPAEPRGEHDLAKQTIASLHIKTTHLCVGARVYNLKLDITKNRFHILVGSTYVLHKRHSHVTHEKALTPDTHPHDYTTPSSNSCAQPDLA